MAYVKFRSPTSLIKRDTENWRINEGAEAYSRVASEIVEGGAHRGIDYVTTLKSSKIGPLPPKINYYVHFVGIQFPRYQVHSVDATIPLLFGNLCSFYIPSKVDFRQIAQLGKQHLEVVGDREVVAEAVNKQFNTYEPKETENGIDFRQAESIQAYLSIWPSHPSFFSPVGIFVPSTVAGSKVSDARAVAKGVIRKAIEHRETMQQIVKDLEDYLERGLSSYDDMEAFRKDHGFLVDD